MTHPQTILLNFIEGSLLKLNPLIETYESDFHKFCQLVYPDKINKFAFYSVKSKELAKKYPTVIIQDSTLITFEEDRLGNILPQFVDWFKIPMFTTVTKNGLKVTLPDNRFLNLEFAWFLIENQYFFLNTNILK